MKINRLFVLLAFLAVSCGAQASQGLKIETQIERVGLIQYLPIYMNITFINEGPEPISLPEKGTPHAQDYFFDSLRIEVLGQQDLRCFRKVAATQIPPYPFPLFSIPSGGVHTFQMEIASIAGLLNPGTYQVRVVWDSRQAQVGWKGYAEADWSTIEIQRAQGVDHQFLLALKEYSRKIGNPDQLKCLIINREIPSDHAIVMQFPTSTYSGCLLVGGGASAYKEARLRHVKWLLDTLKAPQKITKYTFDRGEDKTGARQIEQLSAFLAANPDWPYVDWMRFEIFYWRMYRGEFDSAKDVLQVMEKENGSKDLIERAKELIPYIPELEKARTKMME